MPLGRASNLVQNIMNQCHCCQHSVVKYLRFSAKDHVSQYWQRAKTEARLRVEVRNRGRVGVSVWVRVGLGLGLGLVLGLG